MKIVFTSRILVEGFFWPQISSLGETLSPCLTGPHVSHSIPLKIYPVLQEYLRKRVNNSPSLIKYLPDKAAGASEVGGWI